MVRGVSPVLLLHVAQQRPTGQGKEQQLVTARGARQPMGAEGT